MVVAQPNAGITDYWAPVITVPSHPQFIGAVQLTNNSAELSGAFWALWVTSKLPPGDFVLGYDSEYSRNATTGAWKARCNARLAAACKQLLNRIAATHKITWRHIDSHTGDILNERVDRSADRRADGYLHLPLLADYPRAVGNIM